MPRGLVSERPHPHAGRGPHAWRASSASRCRRARAGRFPSWPSDDEPSRSRPTRPHSSSSTGSGSRALPVTLRAFIGVEAEKWPTFFPPEKAYLDRAAGEPRRRRDRGVLAGVARLEAEAGLPRREGERPAPAPGRDPVAPAPQGPASSLAARDRPGLPDACSPRIDAAPLSRRRARRVVVILYGQGIAIQRDKLWARLRGLRRAGPPAARRRHRVRSRSCARFRRRRERFDPSRLSGSARAEAWLVEAGRPRCTRSARGRTRARGHRPQLRAPARLPGALARSLYKKVLGGVSGPQELAAYVRELDFAPAGGSRSSTPTKRCARSSATCSWAETATLLVNNTFVEWAAVQALKRAAAPPARRPLRRPRQDEAVQQPAPLLEPPPDRPGPDPGRPVRLVRGRRAALLLRLAQRREERRLPREHAVPAARGGRRRDRWPSGRTSVPARLPVFRQPPSPRWPRPWRPGWASPPGPRPRPPSRRSRRPLERLSLLGQRRRDCRRAGPVVSSWAGFPRVGRGEYSHVEHRRDERLQSVLVEANDGVTTARRGRHADSEDRVAHSLARLEGRLGVVRDAAARRGAAGTASAAASAVRRPESASTRDCTTGASAPVCGPHGSWRARGRRSRSHPGSAPRRRQRPAAASDSRRRGHPAAGPGRHRRLRRRCGTGTRPIHRVGRRGAETPDARRRSGSPGIRCEPSGPKTVEEEGGAAGAAGRPLSLTSTELVEEPEWLARLSDS